jgi:hypothetical protein
MSILAEAERYHSISRILTCPGVVALALARTGHVAQKSANETRGQNHDGRFGGF